MARGLQAGFRLGEYGVVPEAGELRGPAGVAVLHPQTMRLLVYLAEHAGELIDSAQLREAVWPSAVVDEDTVRRCVKELHHRLRDNPAAPTYIETRDGGNYRLIAPVTPRQQTSDAEPGVVQQFLGQLKRRKVFRVTATYAVVGWLLLQIADVVSDVPWMPDGALTALLTLFVAGFPIVIILSWALEITEKGVVLDPETARRWPTLTRIWRPLMLGLALAIATAFTVFLVTRDELWAGHRLAAVVLPFDDLSPVDSEFSCGWLTEEMTDALANIRELRVAARTSAEALAKASLAVPDIASRLRVDYVLEGSCGAEDQRLRITAQLIEAEEGFHLWSQVYDVPWSDRLRVVREIARRVAETLEIKLSDESLRRLGRVPTSNDQAYVSYQQGRRYLGSGREEKHLAAAEKLFRRAIDLDPDFAEAHAGLCDTYLAWYELERAMPRYRQAETACIDALKTQEVAPQVYVALGDLYRYSGEYERSYDSFWRAIQLDDTLADAHIGNARVLAAMDRMPEAESGFQRAIELEPGYWVAYNAFGAFLFQIGRFDEAARQFAEVVSLTPDNPMGYSNLGGAYYVSGRFADAADAFGYSLTLAPGRDAYMNTGTMYFYAGEYERAAEHYRQALELAPEDYRAWGSLGDALQAQDDAAAAEAYREAAHFARSELELNNADALVRADLAHYQARLGNESRARALMSKAIEAQPADMYIRYNGALVFAELGDVPRALENLKQAVKLGYQVDSLPVDPGLRSLQDMPEFTALMSH